ncbi:multiple sugar transport system permease protein [Rhodoferax ferrireducens]|jgi:multiple sugar transport system permease protein|uniref:Multiple sugar transport system permease protein n=1 Tax=Rhodoferax ferrireducens TaxID=192843 RepID=A0ABU2C3H5_9BURK|nr:sugar ABC transporter permease [Rhodoferax ferrireducens]MDR7375894.1 multiple sugar transport system permease protein [Rhodoferax ferrireducens]
MSQKSRTSILPYVLLSPAVLATVIVVFYPMLQALITSLYNNILWKPRAVKFIGLDNYIAIWHDPVFWASLGRTAIWIGLTVPLQLLLGLVTALLLNQQFRWRGLARSLILIPWALPSVVIGLMWSWIYNPQVGLLNDLMLRLGLLQTAMPWLANPDTSLYAIIAALVWQGFPFFAIMILAGLQTIPHSLYEAADIDGATDWQQFWHITMPALKSVLVTAVMLRIIWVANSIDVIYVMTGGGPGYATHTLPLYALKRTYASMDFGYGSALAVSFSLLLLGAIYVYLRRVGKGIE